MPNSLFYYLGDDEAYYKALVGEFKASSRLQIDFKKIFATEEKDIQSLFIKIYKERPACVFIDFPNQGQDYLHLARLLVRTPLEHKLIIVGLVDYQAPVEVLKETLATGVHLTHIKNPETFDVVYDVVKIMTPNDIGTHSFAKASLSENWEAGLQVKVGYIGKDCLHFETDFLLNPGDTIRLNHEWSKKKIAPSKEVKVTKSSTSNLFYHFKYAVDVDLKLDEDHQYLLTKWLQENGSDSLPKRSKILVIDRNFSFYNNQERTDKHPYTLRCVPYLNEIQYEIDRLEPQIIVYALEKDDEKEPLNTVENFRKLLEYVKNKIQDTSPFIIVFNSKHTSKELQDSFGYPQLMSSSQDLSVELLERIAEKLDKKITAAKESGKVFLKKTSPFSIAEIVIPIKVKKISETDIFFESDITLREGMNIHLMDPVDLFVNVRPVKDSGKIPLYQGLIHCIGEKEKSELRRYVNSVIFRDHDAQVLAEAEEFRKLNEAVLEAKKDETK